MKSLVFISVFFLYSYALKLKGLGSLAFQPLLNEYYYAYTQYKPDIAMKYTTASFQSAKTTMVHYPGAYDFALLDFATLTDADYAANPDLQVIPWVSASIVPQVYVNTLPSNTLITVNREVLANIFMGNITKWNDPQITATNPYVVLPNSNITVYYRTQSTLWTYFFTLALSTFSETWKTKYGVTSIWPASLTSLPNFLPQTSDQRVSGAVASTLNSIGYTSFSTVNRDSSLNYLRLYNVNDETANSATKGVQAAASTIALDDHLRGNYSIDSPASGAWPFGTYAYLLIPTDIEDCSRARELFKFVKWTLTSNHARSRAVQFGCPPPSQNVTDYIVKRLEEHQCNGQSLLRYVNTDLKLRSDGVFIFFFCVAIIILVCGIVLSAIHVIFFSNTTIYLLYSIVFVIGATFTLISPVFWYLSPESDSICQARLWFTSFGFAILLGTMFSRTWQLRQIYHLQKQKLKNLQLHTARRSLIQVCVTLAVVLVIDFILLVSWQAVDPLRSSFVIDNEVELEGHWVCDSSDYQWFICQLVFLLILIAFGVYVIYQTWAFQRAALLAETRWVLLALYNVVLTICATVPVFSLISVNDATFSLIVMVGIDISGGGIVAAVLLPRVINTKLGQSSSAPLPSTQQKTLEKTEKFTFDKRSRVNGTTSRTPPEDLIHRLEDPRPLTFRQSSTATDNLLPTIEGETPRPMAPSRDYSPRTVDVDYSPRTFPLNAGETPLENSGIELLSITQNREGEPDPIYVT